MRGGASTVLGSGLQPAGTNPIFSLHPAGTTPAQVGATTGTLEGLRQIARDAYARGSLIEALDLQNRIRDAARASGTPSLDATTSHLAEGFPGVNTSAMLHISSVASRP